MKQTIKLTISGACVALGVILPIAFHSIPNAGSIFLPMHIPVLLCGLICGPLYGFICGILSPIISSFCTGMPPMAILPAMTAELAVYGLISGLLIQRLPVKKYPVKIYISLITAMILGRIVSGLLNAVIFQAGKYSLQVWLAGSFVTALPGIAIQLILIPIMVFTLQRAGFSPTKVIQGTE